MNKKKGTGEGENTGTPGWMVTFSDLSTLLLTFFVLLLSMSTMDDMTLKSIFHNYTSSSGILYFKDYGEIYRPKEALIQCLKEQLKDALVIRKADDPFEDITSQEEQRLFQTTGSNLVIKDIDKGFKMIFGQELLYQPGKAEIRGEMEPVLERIAKFANASSYQLYVDGHTDATPIHTDRFPDNEALSMERALNLMAHLVKEEGVSGASIGLGAYGASHPAAGNETPEGRAKNRRVELIFKNQRYF